MTDIYFAVSPVATLNSLIAARTIKSEDLFGTDSSTGWVVQTGMDPNTTRFSLDGTKVIFRTFSPRVIIILEGLGLTCERFSNKPVKLVDGQYELLKDIRGAIVESDFTDSDLPKADDIIFRADFDAPGV